MVSGHKIEPNKEGGWELTYFGKFSQCIESQTLHIRSLDDLADLIGGLDKLYLEEGGDEQESI